MGTVSKKAVGLNRDRFVGFAFAAAHLLMETDNAGRITFAAGARCGLVSGALEELIGHSLFDYFPAEDHALLRILFQRLMKRGKLDLTHVVMKSALGQRLFAVLGACRLPNHPDRCFLSISIRGYNTGRPDGHRVPDLATFIPVLESRLAAADATEVSQALSMILIEGLQEGGNREKLRNSLEQYLLAISSDGDSAVRLNNDAYAILHSEESALDDIRKDIGQLLFENRASELNDQTQILRVDIEKTELPTADVARAIAFTLKKFAADTRGGINNPTINNAIEDLLKSTIQRVSEVRKTVEQKNFRLVYQPIMRLTSGQIHHVEALMRLGDDESPAEFVKLAEGIGLISDVDLLVVQETLRVLYQADRRAHNVPDIAVNISAASLGQKLFIEQFEEIVRPVGDLSKKLLVEVTELAAVTDIDPLKAALIRLRKMGIRRCLGDIGGGTPSFMALNELNADYAKIDGEVIISAMRDMKDRTILQSIIQICSHLGTVVIAGRVETEEQRLFVRGLGVNLGQGYLLGRPSRRLPVIEATSPADRGARATAASN